MEGASAATRRSKTKSSAIAMHLSSTCATTKGVKETVFASLSMITITVSARKIKGNMIRVRVRISATLSAFAKATNRRSNGVAKFRNSMSKTA